MKARTMLLSIGMVCAVLLGVCGAQNPAPAATMAPAPTSIPTQPPEPTLPPEPTTIPIPELPPAEAAITLVGKVCSYEGPQPIPAQETFSVNWYANSTAGEEFALFVFLVGEGKTKEDVVDAYKREGAPPDWLTQAGTFFTKPNSSLQVTVQGSEGPLFGPLYFICSTPEKLLNVIGPIEVE